MLLLAQQDKSLFQVIIQATYRKQKEDVEEISPAFLIHAASIRVEELEEPGVEHITVFKLYKEQVICLFRWNVVAFLSTTLWFRLEPKMALTAKVTGLTTQKVWPGDVGVDLFQD